MTYKQDENTLEVVRPSDSKEHRTIHGTTRALINNMVQGVSKGYEKTLELIGVGYRAQVQGSKLVLNVGYSHPVEFEAAEGITFSVEKNTTVKVEGIDKELVGATASKFVTFVLQSLTKVKVSVTKVNMYVVKKVKLVNNKSL